MLQQHQQQIFEVQTLDRPFSVSTQDSDISENPSDSGRARIVIEYYLPTPTASEAAMQACQGIFAANFDFLWSRSG